MKYKMLYTNYQRLIESALDNSLVGIQPVLKEVMGYSLLSGGKRIRPVLLLATYDLFDGNIEEALPFACAIEMIHTYSLIHDDLPCMDNDDLRRGKATNHVVYGEGMAVLAGDGLLSLAAEIMSSEVLASKDSKCAAAAMHAIMRGCGVSGMVSGQVRDIQSVGQKLNINEVRRMYAEKTAALIGAACSSGAILGRAGDKERQCLHDYGTYLGTAFQIQDDILDATQSAQVIGKTPGKDAGTGKCTFVTQFGLDEANIWAKRSAELAFESLKPFGKKADFLQKTALFSIMRER